MNLFIWNYRNGRLPKDIYADTLADAIQEITAHMLSDNFGIEIINREIEIECPELFLGRKIVKISATINFEADIT